MHVEDDDDGKTGVKERELDKLIKSFQFNIFLEDAIEILEWDLCQLESGFNLLGLEKD